MKNLISLLNLINEIKQSGNPNFEVIKSGNREQYIGYYNEEIDFNLEKDEIITKRKGVILEIITNDNGEEIICSTDDINDLTGRSIEIIDLKTCYNLFNEFNNSYIAAQK